MKFRTAYDKTPETVQNWDKSKITIIDAQGEHNCYDAIQAAKGDTDIVETLKKYNLQQNVQTAEQFLKSDKAKGIYADLSQTPNSLEEMLTLQSKARQAFDALPGDIKKEFNNSPEEFFKNGEKWLGQKIKEWTKPQPQPEPQPEPQPTDGGTK